MTTIITPLRSFRCRKVASKTDFYFNNFIENLPKDGFDVEERETSKERLNILVLCKSNKQDESFKSTGSIIGYVQSGKTTSFMSVVSAALDNGYNFIIVLGGEIHLYTDKILKTRKTSNTLSERED